jgi:uncharacterized GH25 family protein
MRTSLIFTTLLCATTAVAHDFYLMPSTFLPEKGATLLVGFHVGDSFPESEVSGSPDRFLDPQLIWKTGSAALQNLRVDGKRVVANTHAIAEGNLILAVRTAPRLIELDASKFTEYLREEGLASTIAWRAKHGQSEKLGKERYSKYAKALLLSGAQNGFAGHRVGYTIEIIPQADPTALKPGDSLPIQVMFRGKPAADLQIESAWAASNEAKTTVVGNTDSEGRIRVPLSRAGRWRIHTI